MYSSSFLKTSSASDDSPSAKQSPGVVILDFIPFPKGRPSTAQRGSQLFDKLRRRSSRCDSVFLSNLRSGSMVSPSYSIIYYTYSSPHAFSTSRTHAACPAGIYGKTRLGTVESRIFLYQASGRIPRTQLTTEGATWGIEGPSSFIPCDRIHVLPFFFGADLFENRMLTREPTITPRCPFFRSIGLFPSWGRTINRNYLVITPLRTKGHEPETVRSKSHRKFTYSARSARRSFLRKIISPHERNSSVLLQSTTVGLKSSIIIA